MLLALYVLTITTLLLGAAYVAVLSDTGLSRNDLDQKRAYRRRAGRHPAVRLRPQSEPQLLGGLPVAERHDRIRRQRIDGELHDTPIVASTAPGGTTACSTSNPIGTMIESTSGGTRRRGPSGSPRPAPPTTSAARSSRSTSATASSTSSTTPTTRRSIRRPSPATPPTAPATTATAPGVAPTARDRSTSSAPTTSTARCTARTPSRSAARRPSGAPAPTQSRLRRSARRAELTGPTAPPTGARS